MISKDISLIYPGCSVGNVRLLGSNYSGVAEYCHEGNEGSGEWIGLCSRQWSDRNSELLCRDVIGNHNPSDGTYNHCTNHSAEAVIMGYNNVVPRLVLLAILVNLQRPSILVIKVYCLFVRTTIKLQYFAN